MVDYFEIEIINFMIDTTYKFAINNIHIRIKKNVSCIWLQDHQEHMLYRG